MYALILCLLTLIPLDDPQGYGYLNVYFPGTDPDLVRLVYDLYDQDWLGQYTGVMKYRIRVEVWAEDDPFNEDYVYDSDFQDVPWNALDENGSFPILNSIRVASPLDNYQNRWWQYTLRIDWCDAYNQVISTTYAVSEADDKAVLQYGTP